MLHSSLFRDGQFPEARNESAQGVGDTDEGGDEEQQQNENKDFVWTQPPPTATLPVPAQRAVSAGVLSGQGTSFKTTESVYGDIIFFWELPEVESCEAFLKSCPKPLPGWGGNARTERTRDGHWKVLF